MSNPFVAFSEANSCSQCTADIFGTNVLNDEPACTNCVAGKSSLPGKTLESECTACEVGLYKNIASTCKSCASGKQFVNAVTECTICRKGKYQSSNTTASAQCEDCLVGRYIVDDGNEATEHISCKTCPLGYEFVVDDMTKPCDKCAFSKVRFLHRHFGYLLL